MLCSTGRSISNCKLIGSVSWRSWNSVVSKTNNNAGSPCILCSCCIACAAATEEDSTVASWPAVRFRPRARFVSVSWLATTTLERLAGICEARELEGVDRTPSACPSVKSTSKFTRRPLVSRLLIPSSAVRIVTWDVLTPSMVAIADCRAS